MVSNIVPWEFVHTLGDAHLYLNHLTQVEEQLSRTPFELPKMEIKKETNNIFDFEYEDFELDGYEYHPHIPAPVAI